MPIRWHADDPDLLVQAIEFTARQTGFNPRLVEKDYFCSVVLEYLSTRDGALTFKGGTCLAKIHGSFYRLSEDLDFSISTRDGRAPRATQPESRSLKAVVADIPKHISALRDHRAAPRRQPVDPVRRGRRLRVAARLSPSSRSASRWACVSRP